jgi:hypothetical protein
VWGGEQLRDFTYVDDAVEAFLLAAVRPKAEGRVFNLGGVGRISLRELAKLLVAVPGGELRREAFPADRKKIDIGDYYADYGLITAKRWAGGRARICAGPAPHRWCFSGRNWRTMSERLILLTADPKASYTAQPRRSMPPSSACWSGHYILGPELEAFEKEFSAWHRRRHRRRGQRHRCHRTGPGAAGIGPGDWSSPSPTP